MTGAIEAGKAFVKFVLDDKEFKKSLKGIGTQLQNVGKLGLAATGPLVAGFGAATAAFVSAGSALADISARTGASVESLSELKFAAEQSGTSLGAVERALRKMAKDGLDVSTFDQVAASIAAIEDPSQRAAAAMKAFGKSGAELLPMIMDLQNLKQGAHDAGVVMSTEAANAADKLGDAWDTLKSQMGALAFEIGNALSGDLQNFVDWAKDATGVVISLIKQHPGWVANTAKVTAAIAGLSAATYALGTALTIISAHPIIAFLTLAAAAVIAVADAYDLLTDATEQAHGASGSWEVDSKPGAAPLGPKAAIADIEARGAELKNQINAGLATSAPVVAAPVDAQMIGQLERIFGEEMRATADNTGELVRIQRQALQELRRGGGFFAGGD